MPYLIYWLKDEWLTFCLADESDFHHSSASVNYDLWLIIFTLTFTYSDLQRPMSLPPFGGQQVPPSNPASVPGWNPMADFYWDAHVVRGGISYHFIIFCFVVVYKVSMCTFQYVCLFESVKHIYCHHFHVLVCSVVVFCFVNFLCCWHVASKIHLNKMCRWI